jgi:tRNA A-37 threonylcarbamoyl transferase component Bud32
MKKLRRRVLDDTRFGCFDGRAVSTPLPASARPLDLSADGASPARVTVGQYELLLELASGGMAVVYLGRANDGRAVAPLVAIKRPHRHLATDKNFLAMLLDEARLASAITHENVVKVRELQFHEGEPFIVMDYVEGASLSELRKDLASSERAFDLKVALRVTLDALAGLHAAHELCDADGKSLGIVHRDISPHNILVGSDGRARLTDFGIAQAADRVQVTRTQEVKGKLAYLAPERIDRRRMCTRQSDIFSMGIVLWECLAGRRLFRGDQAVDTLQEVMHAPIPRLRQIGLKITPRLDDVIAKALSRDLDVRFATALDFATALEGTAGPTSIGRPEQVAQLVDALYGRRMAERHQQVRVALADDAVAERLFDEAGFRHRDGTATLAAKSSLDAIRAIAPPAPSERYVFGAGPIDLRQIEGRRTQWALVLGVAAGLIVGAAGALFAVTRSRASAAQNAVVIATSTAAVAPSSSAPGVERPPTDVASERSVAELDLDDDGPRPAPDGGMTLIPRHASSTTGTASGPRKVGVVRNGFTKLK